MPDPLRFSDWTPTARDRSVGYSYVVGAGRRARKISPGRDSWDRAKAHIAASALYSGVEEYKVWGGIGQNRWQHTILVSQEEAETFLRDAADRDDAMRGAYEHALSRRDARLSRVHASSTHCLIAELEEPRVDHPNPLGRGEENLVAVPIPVHRELHER